MESKQLLALFDLKLAEDVVGHRHRVLRDEVVLRQSWVDRP